MLKQQFQDELKDAMRAKDELKLSVLRMLIMEIKYFEMKKDEMAYDKQAKEGNEQAAPASYESTDEDVLSVVQKEIKKRKDAIEQFEKAGRNELADKEKKELEMLNKYLPAQMSEEEIRTLVTEAIAQTGASSPQDMGKVMGALMPKTKGKADGSLVSRIVKESLQV